MPSTFADVLPVQQLSSHTYSVEFKLEWAIGDVPNGGYVTSAFLLVARKHMETTHKSVSAPHPVNLHLEFFRRTSASPAKFTVKDIKLGARISNLHLTLSQEQPDGKWADEVEGYITMTNLTAETGLTVPTSYQPHPPPFPVDLATLGAKGTDQYYSLRGKDPFGDFRRAHQHSQMHLVKPSVRPASRPKSIVDQWIRFRPNKKPGTWTNDALGYLVDIFPQVVEQYVNPEFEAKADRNEALTEADLRRPRVKYWYPTLTLNLDVKRLLPADGVEWLFVRTRAKAILNGRFDLSVEVFDTDGELVAISTHASLILDASRNLTRSRGKDKGKDKDNVKSKM